MTLAFFIADQVLGHEMFFGNSQVSGETFYILACQKRSADLAAICALPTIDLGRDCLVKLMDDRIDMLDGQVRSFQKTAESPIDILHPPR
jgi:hypothetical protein